MVVDGQLVGRAGDRRVRADEPDLERADTTRHVVDDDVGARLRVEGEVAHLEQRAIAPHLEPPTRTLEVEVRDADEDRARDGRRRGPDRQRDDRLVPALAADRQDRDPGRDRRGRRGRERTVGRDEDLGVTRSSGELPGQLEGVAKVAMRAGHLDAVECLADAPEVGRLVDHDPRAPIGRDDADLAAGRQVVERRDGGRLGHREPVREDVRGAHARRRIDDEHDVPGETRRALQERPRGKQREDDDEQQLEEQQEAPAQLLPRRVGLDIGDEPAPQQGRWDDRLVAPELEQVHRDDGRDEEQAEQREWRRERHAVIPARAVGGVR